MKFSILICHLHSRTDQLARLLNAFHAQRKDDPRQRDQVEILIDGDYGNISTGIKRNRLMARSTGEHIAQFDDDDMPSANYVRLILDALEQNPDVVGLKGLIYIDHSRPNTFIHSLACKSWCEENGIYYRYPNHLNPVRRELAVQVGFPDLTLGEDKSFSDRLLPLLKTEVMIDSEPIYHYYP